MCDPVSYITLAGAAISKLSGGKKHRGGSSTPEVQQEPQASQSELERTRAEAEAAQRANMQIAATTARRREQQSLMATGGSTAPQPVFNDVGTGDGLTNTGDGITRSRALGGGVSSRSSTARQASLMSQGRPGGGFGNGGPGRARVNYQ